jgi:hypothetical protein
VEKLYIEREIDIDQKAYMLLCICGGKEKWRLEVVSRLFGAGTFPVGDLIIVTKDVTTLFKGRHIEVKELERLVRKWCNATPHRIDQFCSCR